MKNLALEFQQPMRLKGMRQQPYFPIFKHKLKAVFREPPQRSTPTCQRAEENADS